MDHRPWLEVAQLLPPVLGTDPTRRLLDLATTTRCPSSGLTANHPVVAIVQ